MPRNSLAGVIEPITNPRDVSDFEGDHFAIVLATAEFLCDRIHFLAVDPEVVCGDRPDSGKCEGYCQPYRSSNSK
jgi:hypothetical protein